MRHTLAPAAMESKPTWQQGHYFDRPDRTELRRQHINVSDNERMLSAVGGGLLTYLGLREGSLGGLCLALAGGALAYRGLTGHCHVYEALGVCTAESPGGATGRLATRCPCSTRLPRQVAWRTSRRQPTR